MHEGSSPHNRMPFRFLRDSRFVPSSLESGLRVWAFRSLYAKLGIKFRSWPRDCSLKAGFGPYGLLLSTFDFEVPAVGFFLLCLAGEAMCSNLLPSFADEKMARHTQVEGWSNMCRFPGSTLPGFLISRWSCIFCPPEDKGCSGHSVLLYSWVPNCHLCI